MRQRTTLTISSLACVVITLTMARVIAAAPEVRGQISPSVLSSAVRVGPIAIYPDQTISRARISKSALMIEKLSSNIGVSMNAGIARSILPEADIANIDEIANVDIQPLNEIAISKAIATRGEIQIASQIEDVAAVDTIATNDDINSDITRTIAKSRAIAGASIIRERITANVSAIADISAISDAAIASVSSKIANDISAAPADLATNATARRLIHAEKQIRLNIAEIESREINSIASIRNVLPIRGAAIVDNNGLAVTRVNIKIRSSFEPIGVSLIAQCIGISENSIQANCDSVLTPASINPA